MDTESTNTAGPRAQFRRGNADPKSAQPYTSRKAAAKSTRPERLRVIEAVLKQAGAEDASDEEFVDYDDSKDEDDGFSSAVANEFAAQFDMERLGAKKVAADSCGGARHGIGIRVVLPGARSVVFLKAAWLKVQAELSRCAGK